MSRSPCSVDRRLNLMLAVHRGPLEPWSLYTRPPATCLSACESVRLTANVRTVRCCAHLSAWLCESDDDDDAAAAAAARCYSSAALASGSMLHREPLRKHKVHDRSSRAGVLE